MSWGGFFLLESINYHLNHCMRRKEEGMFMVYLLVLYTCLLVGKESAFFFPLACLERRRQIPRR